MASKNTNKKTNSRTKKVSSSKKSDIEKTKQYSKNSFNETKRDSKKKKKNLWIPWSMLCALILTLSLFKLGLVITILVAIIMIIISAIAYFIGSVKANSKKRKILNAFLILFLILFILGLLAFGAFLAYITVTAPKFDPKQLETKELSILYDKDGKEFAKLGSEKREKVTYEELPQVLIDAIVATEDSRFFQHNGVDLPRFAKATVGQLMGNSRAGGASTLSMQVVKNSFTSTEASGIKGIIRKFTDIYLAVFKLEKNYTKEQIIEYYVNNHNLGGVIYGVEEASEAYFQKSVSELNLSEAATLAGMFKAPNYYRPTSNPENAAKRRKTVLYLMRIHGYITKEEEEAANAISIESLVGNSTGGKGTATNPYQAYVDTVVDELQSKYDIDPYNKSVLVYTNLDRGKQEAVNNVMNGVSYTWKDDQIQSGVSVLDSQTGKILAIGAGRNRKIGDFNYATHGNRQPGSTAKPLFDYGPGIEYNDWSTYTPFIDSPYSYSNGRSISNWDNSYMGNMTLRKALALSRNIPALKAFQQVDNKKIIEFVQNLGITPEVENGRIHEAHSIGAFSGTNPLEMSAAYAAFSNGGYYNEPYSVEKIVDRTTEETISHKSNKKKVMSDATAYMISSVLQDVSLNGGSIQNVAAKTGTTNFDENFIRSHNLPLDAIRDSWVVGYTTKTVIGMWYGYDKVISREYCLRNIPASIAKDHLFKAIANGVLESNKEEFKMPDSVVKLPVISGSNPPKIAPEGYGGSVTYELFKKDVQPENASSSDLEQGLDAPTNLKGTNTNGEITLTWNGVSGNGNDNYGELGYNVYLDDTLLGFTTSTSFKYSHKQTSGSLTFKVIATYKSYNALASSPATVTVPIKEKVEEKEKNINYTVNYYCCQNENCDTAPLLGSEKMTASSKNTSITISYSQVAKYNVPANENCSNDVDTNKTGGSFNVSEGSIIKIYYKYKNQTTPPTTPTTP